MAVDFTAKALSDSIEGLIYSAALTRIKALSLPQIDSTNNIVLREFAWDDSLTPPYVILSPQHETTNWQDGTNERDQTLFSAMCSIVVANARDVTTTAMGLQLYWRQVVRRSFQNLSAGRFTQLSAFSDGSTFNRSMVQSGEKFIDPAKRMQRDAQYLMIGFEVREPRAT